MESVFTAEVIWNDEANERREWQRARDASGGGTIPIQTHVRADRRHCNNVKKLTPTHRNVYFANKTTVSTVWFFVSLFTREPQLVSIYFPLTLHATTTTTTNVCCRRLIRMQKCNLLLQFLVRFFSRFLVFGNYFSVRVRPKLLLFIFDFFFTSERRKRHCFFFFIFIYLLLTQRQSLCLAKK